MAKFGTFRIGWTESGTPRRFDGDAEAVKREMTEFVQSPGEWDRLVNFLEGADQGQTLAEGDRYLIVRVG